MTRAEAVAQAIERRLAEIEESLPPMSDENCQQAVAVLASVTPLRRETAAPQRDTAA
jgi:hypothetical protein